MTKTEELAFKVRVDMDILDLLENEVKKAKKFLKREHTPVNPDRRAAWFAALNEMQGPT